MIKKLSYLFSSKTKAQEIIFLLHDAKEVVRQGYYEEELPKVEKFCQENKIHLVKSKFKVFLADQGKYSNKGIRISVEDKRRGMYFIYLSKNEEKAWLAAYYELIGNEKDLGLLLGYPSCCVEYFCNNFNTSNPNPQQLPSNAFTNISKREQDTVILSHFPCSSDCEESIQLAKKYLDALMRVDSGRVEELILTLSPTTQNTI